MSGPPADPEGDGRAGTPEDRGASRDRRTPDRGAEPGTGTAAGGDDGSGDPRVTGDRNARATGSGGGTPPGVPPPYGDAWVFERLVRALPWVDLSTRTAVALQVGLFGTALVATAAVYDLWRALPAGLTAVAVAGVGSVLVVRTGETTRARAAPRSYYRLLFGTSVELVLAVLAFVGCVTYLFVVEPASPGGPAALAGLLPAAGFLPVAPADEPLVTALFGDAPPAPAVFLGLLVVWDLCYRAAASWWTAVVSLYRALAVPLDAADARALRRLDALNAGVAVAWLALVPFVADRPVLLAAVVGHAVAVVAASGAAAALSLAVDAGG